MADIKNADISRKLFNIYPFIHLSDSFPWAYGAPKSLVHIGLNKGGEDFFQATIFPKPGLGTR